MNATTTVSWTPEGAVRTAIRRMTKHGKTAPAIVNVLTVAIDNVDTCKGNIGGAIKRIKKHGVTCTATIQRAIGTVLNDYVNKNCESVTATPVVSTPVKPVAVKAAKVDNRTVAEKQHAKDRMAYLRSCRKGNVKLAYVEPISNKRESDLPVATVPTASKLKAPIVLNSFDELDTLLNDLGIA